jgi:hypothetical protein
MIAWISLGAIVLGIIILINRGRDIIDGAVLALALWVVIIGLILLLVTK